MVLQSEAGLRRMVVLHVLFTGAGTSKMASSLTCLGLQPVWLEQPGISIHGVFLVKELHLYVVA